MRSGFRRTLACAGFTGLAANVSAVSDVPEPGEARRRHVRRLDTTNLHGTARGGKAARTRGRCAK